MPPQSPFDPSQATSSQSGEPLLFGGALLEVSGLKPIKCVATLREDSPGERSQEPLWYFSSNEGGVKTGTTVTHEYETETNQKVYLDRTRPILETLKVINSGVTNVDTGVLPSGVELLDFTDNEITIFRGSPHLTSLRTLRLGNNPISNLFVHPEWTNLRFLHLTGPSLTSIDLRAEWFNMDTLDLQDTALTSLTVPSAWEDFRSLFLFKCPVTTVDVGLGLGQMSTLRFTNLPELTTFTTHSTWTDLKAIHVNDCLTLNALEVHPQWTAIKTVWIPGNNLPASEIDAILIAIDGSGSRDGQLRYDSNPGAADNLRSGAANTAISNLLAKGWSIRSEQIV